MTATTTEPTGARARQTYYWQVRNVRTRLPAKQSAAQTWHIQPGHPGGAYCDLGHELDPPAHHTPTLLTRNRPPSRREEQEFRAGCLSCDWEGPIHRGGGFGDGDNQAVEDAHDHAFPGWRALPSLTKVQDRWELPRDPRRWAQLISLYPAEWIAQGAPLLARSRYRGEAHAPPHRGRPRYELRIDRPPRNRTNRATDQVALF